VNVPRNDREPDTTRAIAGRPGLAVEIVHRRPASDFEQISINLQATPSFEAFGRWIETAWLPWLGLARLMVLPWSVAAALPRLHAPGADTASEDDDAEGRQER
jgi:hypothetical protein